MYRKYRTEHSIYMHDSLMSELLWERYLRWSTQRFEQWKSSSYFSLIPFENWPQTMSIFLDRKWFRKGFAKTMREKNHWNHNKKPYNFIRWQNTYIVQEMEQYWYHFITSAHKQIYCIGSFICFHYFNFNFYFHLLVWFGFLFCRSIQNLN